MFTKSIPIWVLIVGLSVALPSNAVAEGGAGVNSDKSTGGKGRECNRHAGLLRKACFADRTDDFLVHIADCIYVTSEEDERACRREARIEMHERTEECQDVFEGRREVCDLVGQERFDIDFDPADFVHPDDIGVGVAPNPYWPLNAGHTQVVIADGEVVVLAITDEVRDVGGLPCRVARDLAFEESEEMGEFEYEAVEVTQDWYAQNLIGDTIYCGENTYEVDDGLIDNTDGSFANGTERARAGFLVRAFPIPGDGDRQEMATDEAEDYVRYEQLMTSPSAAEGGEPFAFPCNGMCLQTFEVNPHDPGEAEHKYYLPGVGFVLATKLEDGEPTGEREEVSCSGDSLDILDDPSCGIGDVEALRDAMCAWAPEAFCD